MRKIFIKDEFLFELEKIMWFENINRIDNLNIACNYDYVYNWGEANESFEEWYDYMQDIRNELIDFMVKIGYSVREFNELIKSVHESQQYKNTIDSLFRAVKNHCSEIEIEGPISLAIITIPVENALREFKGCPYFFKDMFTIFQNGHCPCGWRGKWPKGTLKIY